MASCHFYPAVHNMTCPTLEALPPEPSHQGRSAQKNYHRRVLTAQQLRVFAIGRMFAILSKTAMLLSREAGVEIGIIRARTACGQWSVIVLVQESGRCRKTAILLAAMGSMKNTEGIPLGACRVCQTLCSVLDRGTKLLHPTEGTNLPRRYTNRILPRLAALDQASC